VSAWIATCCDMTVRMILMMRRYRSEKWHSIKV
jgi:Na+-driven multidrug efflux pump